jgi:hypothetical protein
VGFVRSFSKFRAARDPKIDDLASGIPGETDEETRCKSLERIDLRGYPSSFDPIEAAGFFFKWLPRTLSLSLPARRRFAVFSSGMTKLTAAGDFT